MQSSGSRRAARAAALGAVLVCGALYAQSVHLKPGRYEIVTTSQVKLSPEMQARLPPGYLEKLQKPHTTQQCISDTDLKKVSKQLSEERGNDASCKMAEHSLSGDKVKFVMQCQRTTTHFEGTFSGVSFKATIDAQTDHGPMHAELIGKRTGDCSK